MADDWIDVTGPTNSNNDWADVNDWVDVGPEAIPPPTGSRSAGLMSGILGGIGSLGDLASFAAKYNPLGGPNAVSGPDFAPGAGDYIRKGLDWATGIENSTKINEGNIENTIGNYIIPGMALGPTKIAQNLATSAVAGAGDWLGKQSTPTVSDWTGIDEQKLEPWMQAAGAITAPLGAYGTLKALKAAGHGLENLSAEIKPLTATEQTVADLGVPKTEFTKSAKSLGPYSTGEVPLVTTLENLKARGAFEGSPDANTLIKWNTGEVRRLGDEVKGYLGDVDAAGAKPEVTFANTKAFIAKNENQAEQLRAQLENRMKVFNKRWDGTAQSLDLRKKALTRIAYKKDTENVVQGLDKAIASDYRVALEDAAEKAFPGTGRERLSMLNGAQGDNLTLGKLLMKAKGARAAKQINRAPPTFTKSSVADLGLTGSAAASIIPSLIYGHPLGAVGAATYLGARGLASTRAGKSVISKALGGLGRVSSKAGSLADNLTFSKPFINGVKIAPVVKEDIQKAIGWTGRLDTVIGKKSLPAPLQHPEAGVYQRMLPVIQEAKKSGEILPGYPNISEVTKDIIKVTNLSPEEAKIAARAYKEMVDTKILVQMEAKKGVARSSEKWDAVTGKFITPKDIDPKREFGYAGKRGKGSASIGAMAGAGIFSGALLNDKSNGVSGVSPSFGSIFPSSNSKKNGDVSMSASSDKIAAKLQSAMIKQESGGKVNVVSKKGAVGLMQLMPETGKEWHEKLGLPGEYNPKNPEQNKKIGTAYISWLIDQFDGDVELALTAYNQGIGRIKNLLTQTGGTTLSDIKSHLGPDGQKYAKAILNRVVV